MASCIQCGGPFRPSETGPVCRRCIRANATRPKMCAQCGRRPAPPDFLLCSVCSQANGLKIFGACPECKVHVVGFNANGPVIFHRLGCSWKAEWAAKVEAEAKRAKG